MDGVSDASATPGLPPWTTRRRFTVADYHRIAAAGVFGEDDPLELIEGEIVEMSAVGGRHIGAVIALHRLLFVAAADRFVLSVQNPLRLSNRSEPDPDLVLLRPRADRYAGENPPLVEDALLVVEVAESSLQYDSQVKRPLYARHGVPELWIVDLADAVIEVCRKPVDGRYAEVRRRPRGESVEALALPGISIAVADVLPS